MCRVCKKRSSAIALDTVASRIGAAASSWVKARPVKLVVLFMQLNLVLLLLEPVVLLLLHDVVMGTIWKNKGD